MVVVFALPVTFEFERDEVSVRLVMFAPEVVLEAESAVELACGDKPERDRSHTLAFQTLYDNPQLTTNHALQRRSN